MTRYKEWLRANGIKLENDYPCMPFEGIEVADNYFSWKQNFIVLRVYHVSAGWTKLYFDRNGNMIDGSTGEVWFKTEWSLA